MASDELYSVDSSSKLLQLSKPTLRAYASKELYKRWLSTEATPAPGLERRFTEGDLKLFRFIADRTATGESHEEVARRLAQGELDSFDWMPEPLMRSQTIDESQSAQLVPYERLQVAQALMQDARQREEQAQARSDALQAENARLREELGRAQGERDALRRRRPTWWVRLFGE